jgi:hypothetical protein
MGRVIAGGLAAPFHRGVEIGRLDDDDAADMLLGLDEGAIDRQHVPVLEPHDGGRARGFEAPVEDPRTGGLDLLDQRTDVPHDRPQDLGRGRRSLGLNYAQQVLLHPRLLEVAAGSLPASNLLDERGPPGSTEKTGQRYILAAAVDPRETSSWFE